MEVGKSEFEKARKLIFQIAELKNQLQEIGVIRSEGEITSDYAKWFCSIKFNLKLCENHKSGYDAFSKFGEKVRIRSITESDINFKIDFAGIRPNEFDYLLVVFINETTWMIDSIYKVSHDVVMKFLSNTRDKKFEWRRESRSLSLQLYPGDANMIFL